ncbi:MAG: PilZ domain-containing protein [Candidatus Acidiferrales bacterium]|jgi:ActR/RegA family two-component response regulator
MTPDTALEFLLVSADYKTLTAVTGGLKQLGANLNFVPTTDSAGDYIGRRRFDGIFVDFAVGGAPDLIVAIRKGHSNRYAVVFACAGDAAGASAALEAGANFVLHKPVTAEDVFSHAKAARNVMVRERRRYFRHAVSLPASLALKGAEHRATITNISEGGMAVRAAKPLECSSVIDFAFELPPGPSISGRGQITWANSEGMMGITFHFLRGQSQNDLLDWFRERRRLSPNPLAADD